MSHLPSLWFQGRLGALTKLDLSLHLLLAATILIVSTQALLGVLGFTNVLVLDKPLIARPIHNDVAYRIFIVLIACGPLSMLGLAYQRAAIAYQGSRRYKLPLWSLPGMFLCFVAYTYFWVLPSTVRAFARMGLRRDSWAKTARDPVFANFEARREPDSSQPAGA